MAKNAKTCARLHANGGFIPFPLSTCSRFPKSVPRILSAHLVERESWPNLFMSGAALSLFLFLAMEA
jgi:hypothetical protein